MASTKQMLLKPFWRFLSSLRPHKIRNFYGERKYLLSLSSSLPGNLSKIFVRLAAQFLYPASILPFNPEFKTLLSQSPTNSSTLSPFICRIRHSGGRNRQSVSRMGSPHSEAPMVEKIITEFFAKSLHIIYLKMTTTSSIVLHVKNHFSLPGRNRLNRGPINTPTSSSLPRRVSMLKSGALPAIILLLFLK